MVYFFIGGFMLIKRIKCLIAQVLLKLGLIKGWSAPALPETSKTPKCQDTECQPACKKSEKVRVFVKKPAPRKKPSSKV